MICPFKGKDVCQCAALDFQILLSSFFKIKSKSYFKTINTTNIFKRVLSEKIVARRV